MTKKKGNQGFRKEKTEDAGLGIERCCFYTKCRKVGEIIGFILQIGKEGVKLIVENGKKRGIT